MTMDKALIFNATNLDDFIGHSEVEHPLAVQLGGCDPQGVGESAYLCEAYGGFTEINLNCGCPSNRAKKVGFGAELMLDPTLARKIVSEMCRRVTHTKVTVKCRLGVCHSLERQRQDDRNEWHHLLEFVHACRDAGAREFIIHGRSCVLCGLSPAQNRSVPPLRPQMAHQLLTEFPELTFVYNGGVRDFSTAKRLLGREDECPASSRGPDNDDSFFYKWFYNVETLESAEDFPLKGSPFHGVMIGREAYNNPFLFKNADTSFFGASRDPASTRQMVLEAYLDYVQRISEDGDARIHGSNVCNLVKPLHNFLSHTKYSAAYKHELDSLVKRHVTRGVCDIPFEDLIMNSISGAGNGIHEFLQEKI